MPCPFQQDNQATTDQPSISPPLKMNYLLVLMLAYFLVSMGSVMLSMRTTIGHVFWLMSLLYLMVTIGLALFFLNQILSIPKPFNLEYFVQAGEAGSPQEAMDGTPFLRDQRLDQVLPDNTHNVPSHYQMAHSER